jgi:phosphodiesterase/alkaline phosphatase D-like protein
MAHHTAPRLVPTDIQRARAQRPFPLDRLAFSEHAARLVRTTARVWIVCAAAILAILAAWVGVPTMPERGDWDIYAQLGLLALVLIGAVLAWRWEGVGATVIMLSAAGLGALSAAEHTPLRAFLITLIFFIPAVLFWLVWQRAKPVREVAALAVALAIVLAVTGYAANRVYATYFGPVQPASTTALAPATLVEWIWAGGTTEDSVVVKAGLAREAPDARLLISEREDLANARAVSPDAADPTLLAFTVGGLSPDTDYWYAVEAGGEVDTGRLGRLRTFPAGPASFSFAFGSCLNTGSNAVVFDTIRQHDPLFFLVAGDFFYENIEVESLSMFLEGYDANLTSPAQSTLYRSSPFVYTWDDHDFGPNDADSTSPSRPAAQTAYRQVVPHYALPDTDGGAIYQAFTVGRVRFILTDNYSYRSPASAPDGPAKTMLGDEQQAWLEQELLAANGTYPVIVWVNSQPWIEAEGPDATGWGAYAAERRDISDFIVDNGIGGLVMLSGDAHMLAIDDGSNNTYASDGEGPGFPVFHAAALDRHGSEKGGPFSEGTDAGGGYFGLVTVNDDGGDTMGIIWSGRNYKDEELMRYSFTVPVPDARG